VTLVALKKLFLVACWLTQRIAAKLYYFAEIIACKVVVVLWFICVISEICGRHWGSLCNWL